IQLCTKSHPPLPSVSANTEACCFSSSTCSDVVKVQRAEQLASGPLAADDIFTWLSPKPYGPAERKKVSEAPLSLLILILILIITSASCSQPKVPEWVNSPSTCCLKFYEKVLPRRLVVGYRKALNC
uniref:Chemokine interleukin-8-like domain-containing protein n=1 Tax=Piliocolobus tephrosceles TaxID=591936 RepID=A0A8C9LN29_9PRIM